MFKHPANLLEKKAGMGAYSIWAVNLTCVTDVKQSDHGLSRPWSDFRSNYIVSIISCLHYTHYTLSNHSSSHIFSITSHHNPGLLNKWTTVGTDVFYLFNKPYIMVVDYSTNFFDISRMRNAESSTVVQHTHHHHHHQFKVIYYSMLAWVRLFISIVLIIVKIWNSKGDIL